jgi:serine/threonine protein kinase
MAAEPRAFVNANIELLAPIAEGAMGSVWVAFHHRLQIRVAVKFVSARLGEHTAEALARFEQEASTASQIKSPHVVQVFDSGISQEGWPFIVMELLEGENLGERLRRAGRMSLQEAATVMAQVARALTKAHALGIVHRDIKPDNIFLCRTDELASSPGQSPLGITCKVLDFGIAKQTQLPQMGGLTTDGKLVGTPEYMSPEQVLDDRVVDFRADLWALAVVTYVSLTGRLPFEGRTLGQLCINLVQRTPPAPSTLRGDLGPGVDAYFQKALARDPTQRFPTARAMAESFAALVDAPGFVIDLGGNTGLAVTREEGELRRVLSTPPPGPRRGTRWAIATGVVGALAVAGVGFVALQGVGGRAGALVPAIGGVVGGAAAVRPAAGEQPAEDDDFAIVPSTAGSEGRRGAPSPHPPATAASSRPAPPPPSGESPPRRGKEELGF